MKLKSDGLDLLVYKNKPVLEEKVDTGWCSPRTLNKWSSSPENSCIPKATADRERWMS